jgi:hypothetical protein
LAARLLLLLHILGMFTFASLIGFVTNDVSAGIEEV